jgi:hypothetical protein
LAKEPLRGGDEYDHVGRDSTVGRKGEVSANELLSKQERGTRWRNRNEWVKNTRGKVQ